MLSNVRQLILNWGGLFLALVSAVSTIWLAAKGQLDLYIHPRYTIFSVALAVMLLVGIIVTIWFKTKMEPNIFHKLRVYWLATLCIGAFTILLVLPAATLTTASVTQRGMNTSGTTSITSSLEPDGLFGNNDYQQFSIRDWATLLSQTQDASFFTGKSADVIGFISPDAHEPDKIFYVSRFVISCCAVDAQPIGVPVLMPDWKTKHSENSWVHVRGKFMTQQYHSSKVPAVIKPDTIKVVEQPESPYVY